MDARQIPLQSTAHLVALIFAIVSELAQRLGVPVTVAAQIGEGETADRTADEAPPEADMPSASAPGSPGTPPGPRHQCPYVCGVENCGRYCCHDVTGTGAGAHNRHRHRCDHHARNIP